MTVPIRERKDRGAGLLIAKKYQRYQVHQMRVCSRFRKSKWIVEKDKKVGCKMKKLRWMLDPYYLSCLEVTSRPATSSNTRFGDPCLIMDKACWRNTFRTYSDTQVDREASSTFRHCHLSSCTSGGETSSHYSLHTYTGKDTSIETVQAGGLLENPYKYHNTLRKLDHY